MTGASPVTPAPLNDGTSTQEWALRIGDNALVLGQRLSQWCGHCPALEEDIAITNQALDLIGQARLWLSRAADPDDLAYHREAEAFRNLLIVELPDPDYAHCLMRQFLFDAFHLVQLDAVAASSQRQLAEIAVKARKEVAYHIERSADLVWRLGQGTAQSHARMQAALDRLAPYCGEMFEDDETDLAMEVEAGIARPSSLRPQWSGLTGPVFAQAGLRAPSMEWCHKGGKQGLHSEYLGLMLAEMQVLPRSHPEAQW